VASSFAFLAALVLVTAAPKPPAKPPARGETRCLVLDFEADARTREALVPVRDAISSGLSDGALCRPRSSKEDPKITALQADMPKLGCADTLSCSLAVANVIGAEHVVFGAVEQRDDGALVVTMSVASVKDTSQRASWTVQRATLAELAARVQVHAPELVSGKGGVDVPEAAKPPKTDVKQPHVVETAQPVDERLLLEGIVGASVGAAFLVTGAVMAPVAAFIVFDERAPAEGGFDAGGKQLNQALFPTGIVFASVGLVATALGATAIGLAFADPPLFPPE
jgi:hypothetical protein